VIVEKPNKESKNRKEKHHRGFPKRILKIRRAKRKQHKRMQMIGN